MRVVAWRRQAYQLSNGSLHVDVYCGCFCTRAVVSWAGLYLLYAEKACSNAFKHLEEELEAHQVGYEKVKHHRPPRNDQSL
jgi:hypothetical protein